MGGSPERRRQRSGRGEAIVGERGERLRDRVFHGPGDVGIGPAQRRTRLQRAPVVDQPLGEAHDPRLTGQHLEQHAPEAVDVGPRVELAAADRLLGAHVAGGPHRLTGLRERQCAGGADRARDPEVGDDGVVARQQNVLGLDVAVNDPLCVREPERVRHVARDVECVRERELALTQQAMPQRLPFYVRHDVVEQSGRLPGRKDRDDVGMAELGGQVHFADEPLAQQAGADLRVEHLDRHAATRVLLHRQVDAGHAAGADLALHVEARGETFAERIEDVEHRRQVSVGWRARRATRGLLADFAPGATISG